jgi:hypothetical protein
MPNKKKPVKGSEFAVLTHHRNNLFGGRALINPDGSRTTFRGAIVETPDGKQALIPTYWNGAVRNIPDAVRMAIKSGAEFPVYDTVEEAEAAEQRLHGMMEEDMKIYDRQRSATEDKR